MKQRFRYITICLALSLFAGFAYGQNRAKEILDKTTAMLADNWGIKAEFTLQVGSQGGQQSALAGTICFVDDKFMLETPGGTTWFDGKTQWSYVYSSEEVNISEPTPEELQSINPYQLLNTYKEGYDYRMGSEQTYQNKKVYEVILTPHAESGSTFNQVTLYIQQNNFQPLYIEIAEGNGNATHIIITDYKLKQKFPTEMFVFNNSLYPEAEMNDLR